MLQWKMSHSFEKCVCTICRALNTLTWLFTRYLQAYTCIQVDSQRSSPLSRQQLSTKAIINGFSEERGCFMARMLELPNDFFDVKFKMTL